MRGAPTATDADLVVERDRDRTGDRDARDGDIDGTVPGGDDFWLPERRQEVDLGASFSWSMWHQLTSRPPMGHSPPRRAGSANLHLS